MYDYEQIEDSLRFCDRKIYLSHIDDHNTKKYSESEKKKWEDIANDILKEKNIVAVREVPLGLVQIPSELIVGTKTAGRSSAFSKGFKPLL